MGTHRYPLFTLHDGPVFYEHSSDLSVYVCISVCASVYTYMCDYLCIVFISI